MLIGQNTDRTKQKNKALVLQTILKSGQISRVGISERTKLTRATITNITAELIQDGLIHEIGSIEAGKVRAGRKLVALELNGDSTIVVGIHIRMDRLELGLVNLKGEVKAFKKTALPENLDAQYFVEWLTFEIKSFLETHQPISIYGIGVGSVGLVNFLEGKIVEAKHCGWENVDIISILSASFPLPIFLDHNVRAMALAEKMYGKNVSDEDLLFIYIGKGIGAGMVIHNQIFRGRKTGAGEFGHMTYMPNGKKCWCGNNGCLEQYVSEAEIVKVLNVSSVEEVVDAVKIGDAAAIHAVEEMGEKIAVVLTSTINMFNFSRIIFGGFMAKRESPLIHTVKEVINERSFLARQEEVTIENSELGEKIGVLGAASLVFYYCIFQPDSSILR
ncbi:ROK family transcriptional regulator [Niallia sp. 03133]|uniref:ROK family transcriptional regulator n=1 Tax=Niallia sp. 03133 TaxID=3458060 RepID=UPI00404400CF